MAFIQVIEHAESEGTLREIYDKLIESRGKLAEVHKIQSLHPASIPAHMDLYLEIMFSKSPLKRYQRELIAVIVSKTNDCAYCITHHAEALNHFWKDDQKIKKLIENYQDAELDPKDLALCHLAEIMTAKPNQGTSGDHLKPLKTLGFNDRALLDAMLVISYFNFVNRIVLGLGVQLEDNPGGYEYE